jgi:outer membrane protein assembly factor BamB
MKKTGMLLVAVLQLFCLVQLRAQTPKILWWYNTNDFAAGQSAAKDFDGDGKYEVVFSCYRNDSNIYALNAESGTLLWKYNTSPPGSHGCNDVAPIIYDVDNNNTQEVIVPSSCNPKTYCLNGTNGSLKWVCNTRGSDSPPTIADIDNDNKPEILHGEFNGYVICINAENGSVAWEILVDPNSWVQTAPTIVDLNGDGQLDFVVATWNFNNKDSVFAYRGDTRQRMWAYPVHSHMYHGTAVSDLDLDGKPELVIGAYNDTLYCLNGENGSVNWKYKGSGYIGGPASLGDLDFDGVCDVVFPNGSRVTALRSNGTLKWDYIIPNFGQCFRGAALADINNDYNLDVVFGNDKGILTALNGTTGIPLWNLNLATHFGKPQYQLLHAPVIADFNNDDTLDVFIAGGYGIYSPTNMSGNFGRAYMISVGKGKGPNWLMFQRDIRRQSSMCDYKPVTAINEQTDTKSVSLMAYPNPAEHLISLRISTATGLNHSILIYNTEGRLVHKTENSTDKEINLNIEEWKSGVYFIQLKNDKGTIGTEKFVIRR